MDIFYWIEVVTADGVQQIQQYPILLYFTQIELPVLLVKYYPRYLHLTLSLLKQKTEYLFKTTPTIQEPEIIVDLKKEDNSCQKTLVVTDI